MDDDNLKALGEPAIGVSFQIPLENAQPGVQIRMLALQTHAPASTEEGKLNVLLDKMHRVGDRQFRIRELEMMEEEKRLRMLQKEQTQKSYNEKLSAAQERWAAGGNRGAFKFHGKEAGDFQNMQREMDRVDALMEELDKRMDRTRERIGGDAPASATDSGEGFGDS